MLVVRRHPRRRNSGASRPSYSSRHAKEAFFVGSDRYLAVGALVREHAAFTNDRLGDLVRDLEAASCGWWTKTSVSRDFAATPIRMSASHFGFLVTRRFAFYSQTVSVKAGPLGPTLDLVGTVALCSRMQEGGEVVIRFRLLREDHGPVQVELRGQKVFGDVADDDEVGFALPHALDKPEDKTLRPLRFKNLTTGAVVRAWSPGFARRSLLAALDLSKELPKTLLSVAAGALLAFMGLSAGGCGSVGSDPTSAFGAVGVWLILTSIPALIALVVAGRRSRWHGGTLPLRIILAFQFGGAVIVGLFTSQ